MFYRPEDGHGLPHNPFNAIVSPRPIGWISTRGADGSENLAPHSFFNAVAYVPMQVMFASTAVKADRGDTKDTVANIRETGVFCANIVEYAMREVMNDTSGPWPKEVDEFDHAGIERAPCETIACSRVAGAPANLECKLTEIVKLPGKANFAISSASRACIASGPPRRRASISALRDSIHSDAESVEDDPSHPMPTCTPASRYSRIGARPAPIIWFELGQWATPVPHRAIFPISRSFG
jgi:flavin reductase (DIM6/NTAB) family NADH-FMN oxidoreductase RutF